jgi:hypothetical protein
MEGDDLSVELRCEEKQTMFQACIDPEKLKTKATEGERRRHINDRSGLGLTTG